MNVLDLDQKLLGHFSETSRAGDQDGFYSALSVSLFESLPKQRPSRAV